MPSILIIFILFLILVFESHFAYFKFVSLRVQRSFILSGLFCSYRFFTVLHCLFCSWQPQLALSLFFTMILCCCSHIKQGRCCFCWTLQTSHHQYLWDSVWHIIWAIAISAFTDCGIFLLHCVLCNLWLYGRHFTWSRQYLPPQGNIPFLLCVFTVKALVTVICFWDTSQLCPGLSMTWLIPYGIGYCDSGLWFSAALKLPQFWKAF